MIICIDNFKMHIVCTICKYKVYMFKKRCYIAYLMLILCKLGYWNIYCSKKKYYYFHEKFKLFNQYICKGGLGAFRRNKRYVFCWCRDLSDKIMVNRVVIVFVKKTNKNILYKVKGILVG